MLSVGEHIEINVIQGHEVQKCQTAYLCSNTFISAIHVFSPFFRQKREQPEILFERPKSDTNSISGNLFIRVKKTKK